MDFAYTDRIDREAREDEEYDRAVEAERQERRTEKASIFLPAPHEKPPVPSCWSCGAPAGAPCACYCRTEQES